jgi:hypothetical protein
MALQDPMKAFVDGFSDTGFQDTYEELMTSAQDANFIEEQKEVRLDPGQGDKIAVVQKYVEVQYITLTLIRGMRLCSIRHSSMRHSNNYLSCAGASKFETSVLK